MKFSIFFILSLVIVIKSLEQGLQISQTFDKSAFYGVMKTGGVEEINEQITIVHATSLHEKEAYEGALLMKKAGLVQKPKDKLHFFKSGCLKLETAIHSDSNNIEYHFLRFTIQEHAPKVVKYRGQLEKDRLIIQRSYRSLSSVVQEAVLDYSKTSKLLHREDL